MVERKQIKTACIFQYDYNSLLNCPWVVRGHAFLGETKSIRWVVIISCIREGQGSRLAMCS